MKEAAVESNRLWLWALAASALHVQAQTPSPCDVKAEPLAPAVQTAQCNGKSTCALDDLVELKAGAATRLAHVRICTGEAGQPPLVLDLGQLHQSALSYPLGRQVEAQATAEPPGPALAMLTRPRSGPVPVRVVFTDDQGAHSQQRLDLDLSKLWSSGRLKPKLKSASCHDQATCRFRDTLTLRMEPADYQAWMAHAKPDIGKLVLTIDGVRMPGLTAVPSHGQSSLEFRLLRDPDKAEQTAAWSEVFRRVQGDSVPLRIGMEDDKGTVVAALPAVTAQFGHQPNFVWVLGLTVAAILSLLVLQANQHRHHWIWLRDASPIPNDPYIARKMTFSLGRFQMFVWTVVIVVTYFYIAGATGDWNNFNSTALTLMGISAGTALGAIAAMGYVGAANTAVETFNKLPKATDADRDALIQVIGTKTFFQDILSEDAGRTGLHRLQNLMFTAVLVIFFVWMVFSERSMPVLSNTQLALLGISSGAYVGFKAADNTKK